MKVWLLEITCFPAVFASREKLEAYAREHYSWPGHPVEFDGDSVIHWTKNRKTAEMHREVNPIYELDLDLTA
jgi:hypothetical protein